MGADLRQSQDSLFGTDDIELALREMSDGANREVFQATCDNLALLSSGQVVLATPSSELKAMAIGIEERAGDLVLAPQAHLGHVIRSQPVPLFQPIVDAVVVVRRHHEVAVNAWAIGRDLLFLDQHHERAVSRLKSRGMAIIRPQIAADLLHPQVIAIKALRGIHIGHLEHHFEEMDRPVVGVAVVLSIGRIQGR